MVVNVKEPLTIQISGPGNVILGLGIIAHNRPDMLNKFECTLADDRLSAAVAFDFADHNHGIVVQVIHTALSSKSFSMTGYIEGMGEPQLRYMAAGADRSIPTLPSPTSKRKQPISKRTGRLLFACLLIGCILFLYLLPFVLKNESSLPTPEPPHPSNPTNRLWEFLFVLFGLFRF
jgi:hypothetical protein